MRSLSPSSSDSQAAGRSQAASHSLRSVVLPKPAGAEIRVSLRCSPSFNRAIRRGRRTTFVRGGGIYSFVANSGVDIDQLYNTHILGTPKPLESAVCAIIVIRSSKE